MAGVYKATTDKGRKNVVWRVWFKGPDGKRHWRSGYVDKAESLKLARILEDEAQKIRDGLIDPTERTRRTEALRNIVDQVEDYRLDLIARGNTLGHARHTAGALRRLFESAAIETIGEMPSDRIRAALERMRAAGKSARTCNHDLGAAKAFVRWLELSGRIKETPRGILALTPYPVESDRRRVRRALDRGALAKLFDAAESGPTVETRRGGRDQLKTAGTLEYLSGPDRAMAYRIAAATGFRANELRSLTPESFALEGDSPAITVRAGFSKRGKRSGRDDVQPIPRGLAAMLRPWLEGRPAGRPVLALPERCAKMLRRDLEAAGLPYVDKAGKVVDFHSLRHTFVSDLVRRGVSVKVAQTLARHSTPTLTIGIYAHAEPEEIRAALEGDDAQ